MMSRIFCGPAPAEPIHRHSSDAARTSQQHMHVHVCVCVQLLQDKGRGDCSCTACNSAGARVAERTVDAQVVDGSDKPLVQIYTPHHTLPLAGCSFLLVLHRQTAKQRKGSVSAGQISCALTTSNHLICLFCFVATAVCHHEHH
jgi:hypothetical protein